MKKNLVILALLLCAGGQAVVAQTGEKVTRKISTSPRIISVGPRTTYLKEGLSTEDVVKLLGQPGEVSEREERGTKIVSYVFQRGEGRFLVAEFVGGFLVRSRVETRGEGMRAEVVNF
jgi:hypothetical protein